MVKVWIEYVKWSLVLDQVLIENSGKCQPTEDFLGIFAALVYFFFNYVSTIKQFTNRTNYSSVKKEQKSNQVHDSKNHCLAISKGKIKNVATMFALMVDVFGLPRWLSSLIGSLPALKKFNPSRYSTLGNAFRSIYVTQFINPVAPRMAVKPFWV